MDLIALLLVIAATIPDARPAAILTSVDGAVTLAAGSSARRALVRQSIPSGEVVHVAVGGRAVLLCSTDRWVQLTGPADWTLNAAACAKGRTVPAGSYDTLAIENGRIRFVGSSAAIELDTRGDDERAGPIVLAPRDTIVAERRPLVAWTQVPGAVQYEIEWIGTGTLPLKVDADEVTCGAGAGPWRGMRVCSLPFPANRPELSAGPTPLFLRVGSRLTFTSALREESRGVKVFVASDSMREALRLRLSAADAIPADALTRRLLTAGAYASLGFKRDALALYAGALEEQDVPAVRVTLADLALSVRLYAIADREYGRVLAGHHDSAAVAMAELGLGRVALARSAFAAARDHFDRAAARFTALGITDEAAAAHAAAQRAAARVPR